MVIQEPQQLMNQQHGLGWRFGPSTGSGLKPLVQASGTEKGLASYQQQQQQQQRGGGVGDAILKRVSESVLRNVKACAHHPWDALTSTSHPRHTSHEFA